MNFERDQAVDAIVLMFWMSCRSVGKSAFPEVSRPYRNDATRMGMSLQQVERADLQRFVEEKLYIVNEQQTMASKVVREFLEYVGRLQMSSCARCGQQFTTEGRAKAQHSHLPVRGQLHE